MPQVVIGVTTDKHPSPLIVNYTSHPAHRNLDCGDL